jgi:hypothetical protein
MARNVGCGKIRPGLELVLNLVGILMAAAVVCLWFQWAPRTGFDRKTQLVALALLILIVFPVISVTDDLVMAQNPAETDSSARRVYDIASFHPAPPLAAIVPDPALFTHPFGFLRHHQVVRH